MKNRLKFRLIFSSLSFVLLFCLNNVYAKDNLEDIESSIDYFFEKRSDINTRKLSLDSHNVGASKLNNINNVDEQILEKIKVRDPKLKQYFLDYLKLEEVTYSKAKLKEDIINEDISKEIKHDGDKIIVDVVRKKDSIFTIDGIKSDDISTEVARYTFVFDANTHELLDYIPESTEEKLMLEADMKEIIRKEILEREKEELLFSKEKEKFENKDIMNNNNTNVDVSISSYSEHNFDRNSMVNYANKYAYSRNPNYGDFSKLGGDCTNFVSQIIKAGGAPFDTTGSYTWYYYNMNNRSPSWSGVWYLYNYLINNDYIGPQGKLANTNEILYGIKVGDPVFIDFDRDGTLDHAVSITSYQRGDSSKTKVASHTIDRKNYPLSSYRGRMNYVRLKVFGK